MYCIAMHATTPDNAVSTDPNSIFKVAARNVACDSNLEFDVFMEKNK